jgi:hypothetical protein
MASYETIEFKEQSLKIWVSESNRVFRDRLINENDRNHYD